MNKTLLTVIGVIIAGAAILWLGSSAWPNGKTNVSPTPSVSASPSASVSPSASTTPAQPNITISSPKTGSSVDVPVLVTGRARVFENQFTVQAMDSKGKAVFVAHVMTDAKDAGLFGNWSIYVPLPAGDGTDFKVEAVSPSPKGDGSLEGYAETDVKLKTTDTINVYAAFLTDPNTDCTTTTLYPRTVVKTPNYVFMSLVELLKGVAPWEKGATNEIPTGVNINSVKIQGDTVYADFSSELDQGVAGSCRVQGIRAQITDTLKQFLGVNNVVISINGKTEGILQP